MKYECNKWKNNRTDKEKVRKYDKCKNNNKPNKNKKC